MYTYAINRRTYSTTVEKARDGDLKFDTKREAIDALHAALEEEVDMLNDRAAQAEAELLFFWAKYASWEEGME